jgi:branched-chain amino acid aminotransferase
MAATSTHQFPPGTAYIEGAFVPLSEARLPILDWGFLRSDATYDVVHVWKGRFFRLDAHLDRFFRNVERMHLELPVGRDELSTILAECVHRSGLANSYVEVICTRGMSPTFSRDPRDAINQLIAFAMPFGWIADEKQRARGLRARIAQTVTRIPPDAVDPTVKNYHWLDLVMGLYEAYAHDAETVILCDEAGNVTEGPGFNLFAVIDGRLKTPSAGVLQGITRKTVMELCNKIDLAVDLVALPADQFRAADEVFVTSTAGGVMPITVIDESAVGDGKVGEISRRVCDLYWSKHDDPAWSTAVDELLLT